MEGPAQLRLNKLLSRMPAASSFLASLACRYLTFLSFNLLMKSHYFCESDLVGKEQANSPRSPPPSERSLLLNCFPCKSDSAPSCV